jgi:hypothetical protein
MAGIEVRKKGIPLSAEKRDLREKANNAAAYRARRVEVHG